MGVRRSGDDRLADGSFDSNRFARDVQHAVMGILDETEISLVCSAVVDHLTQSLPTIMSPLRDDEVDVRHDLTGWIYDHEITRRVETRLRNHPKRVAQAMYALSIRGRADRSGRLGWQSAEDVLTWLFQQYPDLMVKFDRTQRDLVGADVWYPSGNAPEPTTVIKKDRTRRPFLRPQFDASIRLAMFGRPAVAAQAENIAQWVLWGFAGQKAVHSKQLAVGVLDCLRRIDDIAYLRWAAVTKGIESVTEVRDEALALISHPSTRLDFDIQARPRRPDHRTQVERNSLA